MIRKARREDLPELLRMSEAMWKKCDYFGILHIPFSEATVAPLLMRNLDSESGVVFVSENGRKESPGENHLSPLLENASGVLTSPSLSGFIGGFVAPWFLNSSVLTAHEVIWWVEPEYRGSSSGVRLLEAFVGWAKSKNCVMTSFTAQESLMMDKVEGMYMKMGFLKTERGYAKWLR